MEFEGLPITPGVRNTIANAIRTEIPHPFQKQVRVALTDFLATVDKLQITASRKFKDFLANYQPGTENQTQGWSMIRHYAGIESGLNLFDPIAPDSMVVRHGYSRDINTGEEHQDYTYYYWISTEKYKHGLPLVYVMEYKWKDGIVDGELVGEVEPIFIRVKSPKDAQETAQRMFFNHTPLAEFQFNRTEIEIWKQGKSLKAGKTNKVRRSQTQPLIQNPIPNPI